MQAAGRGRALDAIALSLFADRIAAVCDEMGAALAAAAFSPNIRDRLDYSCAVFDADGALCAQAAHIPVHLGSMAYAMRGLVEGREWRPGDCLMLNDPYLGGTHLPDVTVVSPVFLGDVLIGHVANRAHHADIGATRPGSMPLARRLDEEGIVIAPQLLARGGELDAAALDAVLARVRDPVQARGDFSAQLGANRTGVLRLQALAAELGAPRFAAALEALNDYAERMARHALRDIAPGRYGFRDWLDDDGFGHQDIPIEVTVTVDAGGVTVDFTGTASQVEGNLNCPLSVAAAAVYYVFYCLMPEDTPACAGSLRPIRLQAPAGSLVNACPPAAVAAGNVETSTRIVDALLGALAPALPGRIPAAAHGSMNNLALGSARWAYYETIGGGTGGHQRARGLDAVQAHMTNTRNTPVEVLELTWPLRVRRYAVRRGSGGRGLHRGGHGIVREYEFLEPVSVSFIGERQRHRPWGLAGGEPGAPARITLNRRPLAGKVQCEAGAGDVLRIETAGGGGWGQAGRRRR